MLRVRAEIGGLEISDTALRFMVMKNGAWHTAAVRLPPGIIAEGVMTNKGQFVEALLALKLQIAGSASRRTSLAVAVSLSSVNIYSQAFSLPTIEGENLERAVQLNVQMVSPGEAANTYSGWELLGKDETALRLEVLSAFAGKEIVDGICAALREAGFLATSMESRALSLARLMRLEGKGMPADVPFVFLNLDAGGIDLLIIRYGRLYFEYFTPWKDIQGDEQTVSPEAFERAVIRNLHQVINFYGSHWPEPLVNVVVSAGNLADDTMRIIRENFSLTAIPATTAVPGVAPEWFVVLGSALRGLTSPRNDIEISLLGITAREEFREQQARSFLLFWRIAVPAILLFLAAVFAAGYFFVYQVSQSLADRAGGALDATKTKELNDMSAAARDFNAEVALIRGARGLLSLTALSDRVQTIAAANAITLTRLYFAGGGSPVLLNGTASSQDQILAFKKALENDPAFTMVNLPLTGIQTGGQSLSFSMTFSVAGPNTSE